MQHTFPMPIDCQGMNRHITVNNGLNALNGPIKVSYLTHWLYTVLTMYMKDKLGSSYYSF